ncbi:hypothetical protein N7532_010092 [Penicillium argentinense]|uniref:amidase n=1 Tax=Penicillium argentinense TaxID=1131581 RepID=A0A9W9JXT3_9EURO|nr:uncharacterized protein N7532_010092 [Penicillium argentinense]KAJ5085321.1 hypothetical protein N7532_010092 [Penicillium argentinense]
MVSDPQPRGFKGIITRVSSIRDAYPNSVEIYRDLNTAYQSCYEIADNISEQYNGYKRAGQRISGIRSLLGDCDAILRRVHGFLQRYSSLRSQKPTPKEKFAFVSEDIEYWRRKLGLCREKLVSAQEMLHGADYSSQPTLHDDQLAPESQSGEKKAPPVEIIDPIPPEADTARDVPPLGKEKKQRSRSEKRNARLAAAAADRRWDEVRSLIEKSADVNTADGRGYRPLVYALHGRYTAKSPDQAREASSIAKLLVRRGARFGEAELMELPKGGSYGDREYKNPPIGNPQSSPSATHNSIPPSWRLPDSVLANRPASSVEIIRSSSILTPEEISWTETIDIRDLVLLIISRRVSMTKCLTEIFFERALIKARILDEYFERTGEVVGPVHGIPVSVKDRFDVEGVDTTVGWVGLIGKPAKSSSSVVQLLESMGAVMYVKANIPQSLMMSNSYNHVFGQSVNAFNHALISGGSSGGEGALVGSCGSMLGIGTDIGGSIRVPSGLQGFTRSARVQVEYPGTALSSEPWNLDPAAIPIPWRKEIATPPTDRKLRLGVVFDDAIVKPQPPLRVLCGRRCKRYEMLVTRVCHYASILIISRFRPYKDSQAHVVIEWDTTLHTPATNLWTKSILGDGGAHCRKLCAIIDEPLIEGMIVGTEKDVLSFENGKRYTLASFPEYLSYDLTNTKAENEKYNLQLQMLAQWRDTKVDAVLMPVLPWAGYKPKTWVTSSQWLGYTAMWNLLDYAAVTVPVGRADRGLDVAGEGWESHVARNESDAFNHDQCEILSPFGFGFIVLGWMHSDKLADDIDLVHGMPICVQIVGGRFGEEKAVAVGKVVDGLMNKTTFHPVV